MKPITAENLRQLILSYDLATETQLETAETMARQQKISLDDALIKANVISDINLAQLKADFWHLPFVSLSTQAITEDVLRELPELIARKQNLVPFRHDDVGIHIAMVDPSNIPVRRLLEKKFEMPVNIHVATRSDVSDTLRMYHKELSVQLDEIVAQQVNAFKGTKKEGEEVELPIIKIVDILLEYGARNHASDIHIEPLSKIINVRFRIDGLLQDVLELPKRIHNSVVSRIKILSKLRIDDHFSAQDGRFDYEFQGEKVDVRVSILPIVEGEKVVLRLLSESGRRLSLEELGLSAKDLGRLSLALKRPHGMILSTGPTGSGKTTSLYAIIQLINKRSINISTIEDPVEYDIEGVNQIQVNTKTNLTFAKGLRSILRQDPDVIMIGEIRDEDTAAIAINSAMTGHLVLSTLHANNAATSLPRLMDLKIEPFLVASSINVIIAQRLVRKICRRCIVSVELSEKALSSIKKIIPIKHLTTNSKVRVYQGRGCNVCGHTGYSGRVGIFELLDLDENVRRLIMERKDASIIEKASIAGGMTTMLEDGLDKVKQGITTLEEVMRVMADTQ